MDPDDYPGAENAVELLEKMKLWGMYFETANHSGIEKLISLMKQSLISAINLSNDDPKAKILETALKEFDNINFTKYIIDKINSIRNRNGQV
jgi:hypothetical protein